MPCVMPHRARLFASELLLFQELPAAVAKKPLGIPKLGISKTVPCKKPSTAKSKILVSLTVSPSPCTALRNKGV